MQKPASELISEQIAELAGRPASKQDRVTATGVRRLAACLILWLVSAPAPAADYFKPYSADGAPVSISRCGFNTGRAWVLRQLEAGVTAEASVSVEAGKPISATLLLRAGEAGLQLFPEDIRLHVFPGGKVLMPSSIRRTAYRPKNQDCPAHGEWVHLTFPDPSGAVDQVALVFAEDTVATDRDVRVRPFRFERTDDAAPDAATPVRPPVEIAVARPEELMKSCDAAAAIAGAEELVIRRATLKEPLYLFFAAGVFFQHGRKDDGVFWFYAAQLRTRYQLVYQGGDRGQLMMIMMMTLGEVVNNHALQDVSKLDGILQRVLQWDEKTPNPYRSRPRTEADDKQIQEIYSGLRAFRSKMAAEKAELEQKAREAAPRMPDLGAELARQCGGKVQR